MYAVGGLMGGATWREVRVSMLLLGLGQCMKEHFSRSTGAGADEELGPS